MGRRFRCEDDVYEEARQREVDCEAAFERLGFRKASQGGGCYAYQRPLDNHHYILVTVREDCEIPTDSDDAIAVGLYNGEGDFVVMTYCNGVEQLGRWLGAGLWTRHRRNELVVALCAEWREYCQEHGIPEYSADEILTADSSLSAEQRAWVHRFIERWDRVQNANY